MLSIRTRIILTFASCALAGFYFLVYTVSNEVKPRFREALEESLVETAYSLAGVIATESKQHGALSVTTIAQALKHTSTSNPKAQIYSLKKTHLDLRAYVVDAKGRVVYHSTDPSAVGTDYSKWNDVFNTLQGKYGARSTRDEKDNQDTTVLYVAAPIVLEGALLGVISVGKPALYNNAFILAAQDKLGLLGGLVALVVLTFSILTSYWLSTPLSRVDAYVRALKAGQSTAPPRLGNNEIGELVHLLVAMNAELTGKAYIHKYIQSLTHELKSPLSTILGATELIKEHQLMDPRGDKFLSNISFEAKRMESLISSLLELSTLETGTFAERNETFDIDELISECLETKQTLVATKELTIDFDSQAKQLISGDRLLLALAINNVILNAIEFAPEHSTLTITRAGVAPLVIQVQDQGPGIPEWAKGKVFDSFFSLPKPSSGRKSSGLGLPLSRTIARLHGGEVTILDTGPEGTIVEISIMSTQSEHPHETETGQ